MGALGVTVAAAGSHALSLPPCLASAMPTWCGESFTALAEGLQEALWHLGGARSPHRQPVGGVPQPEQGRGRGHHRALPGTVRALRHGGHPQQPRRGARERLDRGAATSSAGSQMRWRGSRDFEDLDAYRGFVADVVGRANAHRSKAIEARGAAGPARRAHRRLRADQRQHHLIIRLRTTPRVLHPLRNIMHKVKLRSAWCQHQPCSSSLSQ